MYTAMLLVALLRMARGQWVHLRRQPELETPDVRPRMPYPRKLARLGDVPRRLTGFVRSGDPVKTVGVNDMKDHRRPTEVVRGWHRM